MKRIIFIILFYVAFALYFNIGWAIGTYYHNDVLYQSPQTVLQTIANGPFRSTVEKGSKNDDSIILASKLVFLFFWPLVILAVLILWLVAGVYYLLWLAFAGGIAKLIGIG